MTEVRAKKALGQHFLVDLNIARKICDALSGGAIAANGAGVAEGVSAATAEADFSAGAAGAVEVASPAATGSTAGAAVTSVSAGAAGSSGVAGPGGPGVSAEPAESAVSSGGTGPGVSAVAAGYSGSAAAGLSAGDIGPGVSAGPAACVSDPGAIAAPCPVLEVGCGMGVLTQFLLLRTDIETWGAEIDAESVAYLHAHYPQFTPRLIEGDFLRMDLCERFPRGVKIIGNFPYNISSQIFFKILDNRDLVPECVGMIQREVAVRLAEGPGSKEYGILSVLLQAWYDIEYLFTVGEKVFNPPPKVKSAVIRLRRNATRRLGCDERLFVRVVKAAFGQRRKMLRNALRAAFGDFGGAEHPFFTRRAEQLSVADFVELTNWVANNFEF